MDIETRCVKVPQSQIDFKDATFDLSPDIPKNISAPALESIKKVGILHPPILKEESSRNFQIVSGWNRLDTAFNTLQSNSCYCLVLSAHTPDPVSLTYALEAILVMRKPTPIECAHFFQKILRHIDINVASEYFLPSLGHKPHKQHIQNYLNLLRLEEPIIHGLHTGELDEKSGFELVGLSFTERMALFDLIDFLSLSISNQRKLIHMCKELAMRADCSIVDILADQEIKETIHHPHANQPQKTAKIMALLSEKRYPRLSEAEREFRKFVGKLDIGKHINISHAPSFEKDELTLSITFPDREKLVKAWQEIQKINM